MATHEEGDARREFQRRMKAAGEDVEYRHSAGHLMDAMPEAGFAEAGLVWRMFAGTILVGFSRRSEG